MCTLMIGRSIKSLLSIFKYIPITFLRECNFYGVCKLKSWRLFSVAISGFVKMKCFSSIHKLHRLLKFEGFCEDLPGHCKFFVLYLQFPQVLTQLSAIALLFVLE